MRAIRKRRVMYLRRFIGIACMIPLCLSFTSCGKQTSQSNKWKITINSAHFEEKNAGRFVVRMDVVYIGPDGRSAMPSIKLKKVSGDMIKPIMMEVDGKIGESIEDKRLLSAVLGDTSEYEIKQGEKLNMKPFSVQFDIPKHLGTLSVVVGDAPPIRL